MAEWTIGEGDELLVVAATTSGEITVHIPSGQPLTVDADTARDIRLKIGAAIGVAQGDPTS
jgi:hypothetical protein